MTENELRQWLEDGCPQRPHKYRCDVCDEGTEYLFDFRPTLTDEPLQICIGCSYVLEDDRHPNLHNIPFEKVQKTKQLLSQKMNS